MVTSISDAIFLKVPGSSRMPRVDLSRGHYLNVKSYRDIKQYRDIKGCIFVYIKETYLIRTFTGSRVLSIE